MQFKHLLAKSHPSGLEPWPEQLLAGHLREVILAAEELVDATGRDQLVALGLSADECFDRFHRLARLAAAHYMTWARQTTTFRGCLRILATYKVYGTNGFP